MEGERSAKSQRRPTSQAKQSREEETSWCRQQWSLKELSAPIAHLEGRLWTGNSKSELGNIRKSRICDKEQRKWNYAPSMGSFVLRLVWLAALLFRLGSVRFSLVQSCRFWFCFERASYGQPSTSSAWMGGAGLMSRGSKKKPKAGLLVPSSTQLPATNETSTHVWPPTDG